MVLRVTLLRRVIIMIMTIPKFDVDSPPDDKKSLRPAIKCQSSHDNKKIVVLHFFVKVGACERGDRVQQLVEVSAASLTAPLRWLR